MSFEAFPKLKSFDSSSIEYRSLNPFNFFLFSFNKGFLLSFINPEILDIVL